MKRDHLPALTHVFELSRKEVLNIDAQLIGTLEPKTPDICPIPPKSSWIPKNHILSHWLHLYVKDLVHLKGFCLDPKVVHKMLLGVSSLGQIQKSMDFLLREGFWRVTPKGQVVAEENLLVSTVDIPDGRIKAFHKRSLEFVARGIDVFPIGLRRKSSTTLISVTPKSSAKLKQMIDDFHESLQKFIEENSGENSGESAGDELVQVSLHVTPVGVKNA